MQQKLLKPKTQHMKKGLLLFLITASLTVFNKHLVAQQAGKVTVPGYYIRFVKPDTIRGEVQLATGNEQNANYVQFGFRRLGQTTFSPQNSINANAYGYQGRHFRKITVEAEDFFAELLVTGRLNLYEYQTKNANKLETYYVIQDNRSPDLKLRELKKISTVYYKKDLEPYMKDQRQIWLDFDKFKLDRQVLIDRIKEFNRYYNS
jgi:hypothetical protein